VAWARRTYLRELARRDPAAGAAARKLLDTLPHEPVVKRYKLVDAQGREVEVEGMPGHVALFVSYTKAARHRRKGERVVPTLVPRSALRPTTGRNPRGLVSGLLLAALFGACTAPTAPTLPTASLCPRGVQVETLWIAGVPYLEQLHTCGRPAAESARTLAPHSPRRSDARAY
jgi:hypothetical protein